MYRDSFQGDGERHAALRARLAELRKNEREAREIERFLAMEDRRLTLPLLSAMTREQAEQLVFETEGQMCVRFYRRSDGTILTSDCPTGSRRVRWVRGVLASAMATLLAAIGLQPGPPPPPEGIRDSETVAA